MLRVLVYGYLTNQYSSRKIEANANRYTFVWGRTLKYNRGRIRNQLQELWSYAEKVTQAIEPIDKALEGKEVDKKVKQKLNYSRRKWPDGLEKVEGESSLSPI